VANVNSIRCCGFDKAYKALTNSRRGCLSDKELYGTALLSYQIDALASYSPDVCLTQEQYDNLYQKLSLGCGCCASDVEYDNPATGETALCFYYALFTDDNNFAGWEIDGQDFITNIGTVMNTYNGRGETYSEDLAEAGGIITYMGTGVTFPEPVVEDTGTPVSYTWSTPICEQTCWEHEFVKPDFIMSNINLGFIPTVVFLPTLSIAQNINVSIPGNITLFQSFLQSIYGPQVTVTATTLPSTNISVTITGVYIESTQSVTGSTTIGGAFDWLNKVC